MATIIKREGKKGVTYKIQVAIKDVGLGKMVTKSTSWKPEKGMTEKEINTACTLFADEFEKRVIASYTSAEEKNCNVNITFADLSKKWLDRAEMNYGKTYMGNAEESIKVVLPLIGGYRVNAINPSIVQATFDKIDKMQKKIYEIYPKKNLKKILEKQGITFIWLRNETELNCATLSRVFNGLNIGIKYATMFANVCKMDIDRLFDITIRYEPYAEATLRRYKMAVYNVLAYAVRLRILDDNYASAEFVDAGKRKKKPIQCMNEEELGKFYETLCKIENIQWRVAIKTTLLTGMRRGEVCGLNWEDIDFEKSKIHIQRAYTEVHHYKDEKGGLLLKEPKTQSSNRVISIPEILVEELREYKKWYDEQVELWGDKWVESGSVFIQRNGQRINPVNIKSWMTKTCQKAGIKHYSVHSLRHTNITLQIMSGVPLVTVSGRAGHARTSTTTDVYAYYIQSSDKSAAETLNGIFSNFGGS